MIITSIEDKNTDFSLVEMKTTNECEPTPHCQKHGAMNKVSVFPEGGGYWRCCTTEGLICRAGCIQKE